jgi:GT2 family glycosyltransferase
VDALESNTQAGIAFCDAWILDERTRRVHRATLFAFARYKPTFPLPSDPLDVVRLLIRGNFIFGTATIVPRSALDRVGGFNETLTHAEDWEMWLRIIAGGYGVARLPRPYVVYRDREVSLSSNRSLLEDGVRKVYEVVLAEYDLPDDVRAIAEEELEATRERLVALRTGRPRSRLRRALSAVKQRLLWRRYFYARVPTDIAAAFPDLARL